MTDGNDGNRTGTRGETGTTRETIYHGKNQMCRSAEYLSHTGKTYRSNGGDYATAATTANDWPWAARVSVLSCTVPQILVVCVAVYTHCRPSTVISLSHPVITSFFFFFYYRIVIVLVTVFNVLVEQCIKMITNIYDIQWGDDYSLQW